MILSTMRFAGFEWEHNPLSVDISHRRVQQKNILPFYGVQVADLGRQCRVISGKGELVGKDCIEQFKCLEKLYLAGKSGVLSVPGLAPVYACFSGFSAVGETTADLITYTFEFTETDSGDTASSSPQVYICKGTESLFDIAYETGASVDELVALNPWVKRPDELFAGKRVRLC